MKFKAKWKDCGELAVVLVKASQMRRQDNKENTTFSKGCKISENFPVKFIFS